jgi:ParB family chromosome partitioning protein
MQIKMVPLSKLKRDTNQPRQYFDEEKIKGMAQSIYTEGVINAVEIDKDYKIITGELRVRASKLAGLKEVPCKIISVGINQRFRRQVIENLHNSSMTDWDTAKALQKLLDGSQATIRSSKVHKGGLPDKGLRELSRQIGKSLSYILEKLALLNSSLEFQEAVKQNKISGTFLRAINRAPEAYKEQLEKKIIAGDFATRDNALMVVKALKIHPEKSKELLAEQYKDSEPQKISQKITKIIPNFTETPASDALAKAFEPSQEITAASLKLRDLLKKYSVADVGSFNVPRVVLALRSVYAEMENWLKKTAEKQLTEGG